jgi:ketosteroid isomerase-like protein
MYMKTLFVRSGFALLMMTFFVMSATSQTNDELREKIVKINQQMAKAMMEGNSQATLGFYAKDAISMPNYGEMVKGIDAIKKSNDEMVSSGMKVNSMEFNTVMVNTYGNVVSEIGTYKMNATMPGMASPMEDTGKYLTLWEKQPDGSLKIKVETWNTDKNPMMPKQ